MGKCTIQLLGGTAGVCIEEWIAEDVNVPSSCSVAQLVCVLRSGLLRMSIYQSEFIRSSSSKWLSGGISANGSTREK